MKIVVSKKHSSKLKIWSVEIPTNLNQIWYHTCELPFCIKSPRCGTPFSDPFPPIQKMRHLLALLIISTVCGQIFAQTDSVDINKVNSLVNETMLHPGEAFTAYTYKKGEWFYAQGFYPYPGFIQVGLTDWLTVEAPLWEWFGGVVSVNYRFKLTQQKGWQPALAYESQYQYLPKEIDQSDGFGNIRIWRQGNNWYHRINSSWKFGERFFLHASGGATWAEFLGFENVDTTNYQSESYSGKISPDFSVGLDWRTARWITFHSSASYGTTYMYLDNIARKKQITFGSRLAPFISSRRGFLNCFRIELVYFAMQFGNVKPVSQNLYGFIYWQWKWKKQKTKTENLN